MSQADVALISIACTLLTSVIIIAWHSGKDTQRIQHLEEWRRELMNQLTADATRVDRKLDDIARLLSHQT